MKSAQRMLIASFVMSIVFTAGCASEGRPAANTAKATDVDVVNISFSPATLKIDLGTQVTWANGDEGVHHTATSGLPGDNGVPGVSEAKPPKPDGLFDGDLPGSSSRFTFKFDEPGTYAYFCRIHPSMTGEVIVQ